MGHLPARAEGSSWHLLYSSSVHGYSLRTLYRQMLGVDSPILLVVMDTQHHVSHFLSLFLSEYVCFCVCLWKAKQFSFLRTVGYEIENSYITTKTVILYFDVSISSRDLHQKKLVLSSSKS